MGNTRENNTKLLFLISGNAPCHYFLFTFPISTVWPVTVSQPQHYVQFVNLQSLSDSVRTCGITAAAAAQNRGEYRRFAITKGALSVASPFQGGIRTALGPSTSTISVSLLLFRFAFEPALFTRRQPQIPVRDLTAGRGVKAEAPLNGADLNRNHVNLRPPRVECRNRLSRDKRRAGVRPSSKLIEPLWRRQPRRNSQTIPTARNRRLSSSDRTAERPFRQNVES